MEKCKTNYFRRTGATILAYRKMPVETDSESLNAMLGRIWEQIDTFAEQLSDCLSETFDRHVGESQPWIRRELTVRMECNTIVRHRKSLVGMRFKPCTTKCVTDKAASTDLRNPRKTERNPLSIAQGYVASERKKMKNGKTNNLKGYNLNANNLNAIIFNAIDLDANRDPEKTGKTDVTNLGQKEFASFAQWDDASGWGRAATVTGNYPASNTDTISLYLTRSVSGVKPIGEAAKGRTIPTKDTSGRKNWGKVKPGNAISENAKPVTITPGEAKPGRVIPAESSRAETPGKAILGGSAQWAGISGKTPAKNPMWEIAQSDANSAESPTKGDEMKKDTIKGNTIKRNAMKKDSLKRDAVKGETDAEAGFGVASVPDTVTYIQVTVQSMYGLHNRPADGTARLVILWDTQNGRCIKITG